MSWGFFKSILFAAAIVLGVIATVSTVALGFTTFFNSPIISALVGTAAGLGVSYMCYQQRSVCFLIAAVTGISGLLLPWFVFLLGGGLLATIGGLLLSSVVTSVGSLIGLLIFPIEWIPGGSWRVKR